MCQAGEMYVSKVEKSEVKESERDQIGVPHKDAVLPTERGKQKADDTARADTAQTLQPPLQSSGTLGTSQ